jgi:hypothetical protein
VGATAVNVGGNGASTSFTGTVAGTVRLTKVGAGTLELGAQDNLGLAMFVNAGRVRALGDLRVGDLQLTKADPGMQSVDLAGRTIRVTAMALILFSREGQLNLAVGNASDGIYDSAHPELDVGMLWVGSTLTIRSTLPGDANLDGRVDFTDLVALAQNYNKNDSRWGRGDFTHDGSVDFNDLVRLAQHYNTALPSGSVAGAPDGFGDDLARAFAAVPEPATLAATAACGFAHLAGRRRRQP